MKSQSIDLQYFPCVVYMSLLEANSYITFYLFDKQEKVSFFNRSYVLGSNGLIQMSVPLVGGRGGKSLIKDVRISYSLKWQIQHWRTITSCYSRSPFFSFYADELQKLFEEKPVFMVDLNLKIMEWLAKVLRISFVLKPVSHLQTPAHGKDFRNFVTPRNFQQFSFPVTYSQVFEEKTGFQTNLSILDLLFNRGPQSSSYLKAIATHNTLI